MKRTRWSETPAESEAMLAKLPDSVREALKETAKEYWERARDYKSIIEAMKGNRSEGHATGRGFCETRR